MTNKAFDYVRNNAMFESANGGRDNAKKIIVLVTDDLNTSAKSPGNKNHALVSENQ